MMKKVFLDKDGVNPDSEGFRAPTYETVPNPDFDPEVPVSDVNQMTLTEEVPYVEIRPFIDLPDNTNVSELIIEGGVARTMTSEEILAIAQADAVTEFKAARPAVIQAIKVTVDDMEFDGDEVSQTRMSRAITVMDDLDTTTWVLANNTPTTVTKAQLKAALRLAGEAQTAAWVFS